MRDFISDEEQKLVAEERKQEAVAYRKELARQREEAKRKEEEALKKQEEERLAKIEADRVAKEEKEKRERVIKPQPKKEQSNNNNTKNSANKPSRSGGRDIGYFEATAYTDNAQSQGKWVGQTATGMKPQVGVIAVDPKVIPLGTKLYIEGYGNAIAGDTGGAIKGRRVDLFLNTQKECMRFGRKRVKITILD